MALLSLALLLSIPALYVTVTSFSFILGLKYTSGQAILSWPEKCHTRKSTAAYTRTLVFGLSHRGTAQNCPYPYPPSKLGTVPSDSPFSGHVVSKV